MSNRHRARRLPIAVAGLITLAGCGSASDGAQLQQPEPVDSTPPSQLSEDANEQATSSVPASDPPVAPPSVAPSHPPEPAEAIQNCADVTGFETAVIGTPPGNSPGFIDPLLQGVLLTYARDNAATFGGLWIDNEAGGTVVLAFTDDPEMHRQALAQRSPSPDDVHAIDPPPEITDDRPIGEWGVAFDLAQVRYTEAELVEMIAPTMDLLREAGFPVDGAGGDIQRNRIGLTSSTPITPADLEAMTSTIVDSELVPLDMVCFEGEVVDRIPEPIEPGTPLEVIVLPDEAGQYGPDTQVECGGPAFPLGSLQALAPLDELDADLRSVIDTWVTSGEGSFGPQDGWALLYEDGERAQFIHLTADGVSFVGAEMGRNGWVWAGSSSGGTCVVNRVLPSGLGSVEWQLDPAFPAPGADSTEVHVLVTELACTGAQELGERLLGPQVVETDDAVRIAFAAIPLTGMQTCPGNPSTAVTIELNAPLADRALLDGLTIGPIADLIEA